MFSLNLFICKCKTLEGKCKTLEHNSQARINTPERAVTNREEYRARQHAASCDAAADGGINVKLVFPTPDARVGSWSPAAARAEGCKRGWPWIFPCVLTPQRSDMVSREAYCSYRV